MASLTSSSQRSSYSSSSRYSTSSSYRSEGSLNGSSDSVESIFEPFFDSAICSSPFGEESPGRPNYLHHFTRHSRSSYEHPAPVGGSVTGLQTGSCSGVQCLGDTYYMSVDISQFEPHDVVVMAFNNQVVIHAQKVLDDGSVKDTFTQKSSFPEDMDPLSVGGTLSSDGTLLVSVHRTAALGVPDPLIVPTREIHV
ncbi:heat shock protein beta-7 [Austrofundulus limnaeus]|uniref:Heat shock protein beta-7 n=1 Tax=Austrofundulus limnaeus TaxID=52670 RepID=A0A2I4CFZ9_AUSLI|nr:PREDICTED: heat shock protein beta-7-like [Austrofundulus limnaeus]